MNPELIRGTVASAVRWLIPLLIGWLGLEAVPESTLAQISAAVGVVVVFVLSLVWSVREKKKNLAADPNPVVRHMKADLEQLSPPAWALVLMPAAAAAMTVVVGGCVSPKLVEPMAANQIAITAELGARHMGAMSLIRRQTATLAEVQRIAIAGDAHRSLISAGYLIGAPPTFEVDTARLADDVHDPTRSNALLNEIRTGRMGVDGAAAWLTDYAAAIGLGRGAALVDQMLAELQPVASHDAAVAATLAAIDAAAEADLALLAEQTAIGDALVEYARSRPQIELSESLVASVVARIPPTYQEDARALLEWTGRSVQ